MSNEVAELKIKLQELEAQLLLTNAEKQFLELQYSSIENKNRKILQEKQEWIQTRQLLLEQVDKKDTLIEALRRMLFGKKSEKFQRPDELIGPLFDDIFNSADEVASAPETIDPATATVPVTSAPEPKKKRKSPTSKADQAKDNPNLETHIVDIPIPDSEKTCDSGHPKLRIGYEEKSYFHHISAKTILILQRREIWACALGCEGQITTAQSPPHALPKAGVSPAFLAHMIITKMVDRQPWYHQSVDLQRRHGITITRATMAKWAIKLADQFAPLYELMKKEILAYDIAALDCTFFNVLKSKQGPGKRACIWSLKGGPPDKRCITFAYQDDKGKKEFLKQWIGKYAGIIMCDGDPDYITLMAEIGWLLACCNSHSRRKFEPLAKKVKTPGLVHEYMEFYRQIYILEAEAKELKLNIEEHTIWRDQKMRPLFEAFHKRLESEIDNVHNQSDLKKAMKYTLKLWEKLTLCLTDARIDLDNNSLERDIRKFVMGRNNFLFADTIGGAEALCLHFSLILSARQHGLNERKYYEYLIKTVPSCDPDNIETYRTLLPWNVDKQMINSMPVSPTGWD